jgi:hypothetical protein
VQFKRKTCAVTGYGPCFGVQFAAYRGGAAAKEVPDVARSQSWTSSDVGDVGVAGFPAWPRLSWTSGSITAWLSHDGQTWSRLHDGSVVLPDR